MREVDIDLSGRTPRLLGDSNVRDADVVVTMGCGDERPFYPGRRYEDWDLTDPAGKSLAEIREIREIRDEIDRRVRVLVNEVLLLQ